LKSRPILWSLRRRFSQILVNDGDLFPSPTQIGGALLKRPLPKLALAVMQYLMGAGLSNINHRHSRTVVSADIIGIHRCPPALCRPPVSASLLPYSPASSGFPAVSARPHDSRVPAPTPRMPGSNRSS